ncbi:MAG: putative 40S ribosomal protein S3-3 [Streblomastix strix]|uniref:Small ribosomal subunit protein uS3 n=1 Tax=Streblomastix strix TaxID=222440 RepID=A0A5J4WCY4_9EUKA|nr:MAG: putative 40S ribosomal protein S3-3 [Streblomastix strix]
MAARQQSKKRKFIADGVLSAELNSFFRRELAEEGYSGLEFRVVPPNTEITVRATRTQSLIGDNGKRIRELTSLIEKRWKFPRHSIKLLADRLKNRALSAVAQAESMVFKIMGGLPVRRAAYGILRFVMENGARGVEVKASGKLRGQRGKMMKFRDGYMIKSGDPKKQMVDVAVRHLLLEQGCLGIQVKIMLPTKKQHEDGKDYIQPDVIDIFQSKEDELRIAEPEYKRVDFTPAPQVQVQQHATQAPTQHPPQDQQNASGAQQNQQQVYQPGTSQQAPGPYRAPNRQNYRQQQQYGQGQNQQYGQFQPQQFGQYVPQQAGYTQQQYQGNQHQQYQGSGQQYQPRQTQYFPPGPQQ